MKRSDWLFLALLSLPWGCSFLFFKVLAGALPPLTVAFGRVAIAALALGLALRQAPRVWKARRHWLGFLGLGLFSNAVPFTLFAWGAHRVPAGTEAICNALSPMLTVLTLRVAGRSGPLGWNRWAGVALGFAGVFVLVGPGALGGASGAGVLACVAAAASYAVGALFMQDLRSLPPLVTATAQLTASSALLLLPALLLDQPWAWPTPSAAAWAALLGLALFSTAFAYIIWFKLNASAGPANAMLVTYLIPVTALTLDAAVLGEAITGRAVGGALLIALGLAVLDGRWLPRRAEAAP
jgi:drug/metabolite transporter (DMT)-like permease